MQWEGLLPDEFVFASVLSSCASEIAVAEGKRVHARMIGSGFESTVIVQNTLANMYGKGNSVEDARRMFEKTIERNVISWTAMIAACMCHGHDKEALLLYVQMQHEGVIPNKITFISILDACASQEAELEGKRVHACIVGSGQGSEIILVTGLVNMYGKCGSLEVARTLFESTSKKNRVLWTAMISGHTRYGDANESLQLFNRMLWEGVIPDKVTLICVLDACARQTELITGRQVHDTVICNNLESDTVVATALIDMYGKCSRMEDAWRIFNTMRGRNVLSWTAMIAAYVQHGNNKEALELFVEMQRGNVVPDEVTLLSIVNACSGLAALTEGKWVHGFIMDSGLESDVVLATALVNMYGKCGSLEDAQRLFRKMPERNLVSWTAMITAYAQHGYGEEAVMLFAQMQLEGVTPNRVTFVSILSAFSSESALTEGKRIHICITNSEFHEDVVVITALVNMYGKCGSQDDARRIFDGMAERNVVSWNTMITAYGHAGDGKEALQLFDLMQRKGVVPNKATFVSILDACASQVALVRGQGTHALVIHSGFELDANVGNAVINLYGKCGRLDDAQKVFDEMLELDVISWNTMIAAFAQHGHAKKVLRLLTQMQEEGFLPDKVTFVSVLSACSHAGLVAHGQGFFLSLIDDHDITPTPEHYHCMIDMLGRAGLLNEAEDLISRMPFQPTLVTWMTLLGACRDHLDVRRGELAVRQMVELDSEYSGPYVMLSNIYGAIGSGDADELVPWKKEHRALEYG